MTDEPATDPGGGLVGVPDPGPARRVRLDLAYDGTDFSGWARQPGRRTGVDVGRGQRTVRAVEGTLDERAVGPHLDLGVLLDVVAGLLGDPAEAVVLALDRGAGARLDVRRGELERGDRLQQSVFRVHGSSIAGSVVLRQIVT